jgi:hypothetical protein
VWPVRASLAKYIAAATTGAYKDSQYRTVYFFESGADVDRKFQHYVEGYTQATQAFLKRHKVFPILVAMERLDTVACTAIEKEIPGTPVFTSDDFDMCGIGGRHNGRAHPKPDARARPPALGAGCG